MQVSDVFCLTILGYSAAQKLASSLEVLRPEWDLGEECVCALNFTSLQATPHPTAGQPAQKTHKKQPFGPLRLLIGFRKLCSMTDLPEPEPSDCSLLHNVQMSNTTTEDPARPHYQHRSTTNHCPLQAKMQLNLRFSVCCRLRLSLLFSQSTSEASDFPLTVI